MQKQQILSRHKKNGMQFSWTYNDTRNTDGGCPSKDINGNANSEGNVINIAHVGLGIQISESCVGGPKPS